VAATKRHAADLLVVVQLINDFNETVFDSLSGRGRSALRSARAVFEHVLNLITVLDDPGLADRLIDHWPVGVNLLHQHSPFERRLRGKDLKSYRHRVKVTRRDAASDAKAALDKYGPQFARSWHPTTIRDRAEDAGLGEEYAFYRAASQAAHGSPAGATGTFWLEDGRSSGRFGPSMAACSVALSAAVDLMVIAMDRAQPVFPTASAVREAVLGIGDQVIDLAAFCAEMEEGFRREYG
jgi:hypothetical protein